MYPSPDQFPNESVQTPVMPEEKRPSKLRSIVAAIAFPLLMFVAQYAASFVAGIVFGVAAGMKGGTAEEMTAYTTELLNQNLNWILVAADLLILLVLLLWFGCRRRNIPKALEMNKVPLSRILLAVIAGIGLSFVLSYAMTAVEMLFPSAMEEYNEHMSMVDGASVLAYILAGIVLAPIVEELLFRALSVKYLDRVLPRSLSVLLVAALFGLAHGNIIQGIYAGTLGAVLGWLYFAYDSVLVPMALHFGFNLVSIFALIDTEKMNAAQELIFGLVFMLIMLVSIVGGSVALVLLFVQRKHPVLVKQWKKPRGKTPSAPSTPNASQNDQ